MRWWKHVHGRIHSIAGAPLRAHERWVPFLFVNLWESFRRMRIIGFLHFVSSIVDGKHVRKTGIICDRILRCSDSFRVILNETSSQRDNLCVSGPELPYASCFVTPICCDSLFEFCRLYNIYHVFNAGVVRNIFPHDQFIGVDSQRQKGES